MRRRDLPHNDPARRGSPVLDALVCLLLTAAVLTVYAGVRHHDFINFDDPAYISDNPRVRGGLTPASVRWAFTTFHASNWHPLTWLSHMLDVDLFGMQPGRHHLVNLLLHAANTLMLFVVLRKMSGDRWAPAFVAAVFALHPLHVESVAWAAERKDVLSTFLGLTVLWRYTFYVADPRFRNYWPLLFYFALSLMAKPMTVTLPFLLLLLDHWPLKRLAGGGGRGALLRAVTEKIPLFLLSFAACVVTFAAQRGSAMVARQDLPLGVRLAHGVVSYAEYLRKTLWPTDLGVFYPHPGMPSPGAVAGAGALLLAVTLAAVGLRRRHPYLLTGWLWYLGTLVPVIGVVPVGLQGTADRYTYLPMTGILVMAAWGARALGNRRRPLTVPLVCGALLLTAGGAVMSRSQAAFWRDSVALYGHTLDVTRDNYIVHNNLGIALADRGLRRRAAAHYLAALRIKPDHERSLVNLANLLSEGGRADEAVALYRRALAIDPDSVEAHANLAVTLAGRGQGEAARSHFAAALRVDPSYANGRYNYGNFLAAAGEKAAAMAQYRQVLGIDPRHAGAHNNLAIELAREGRAGEAIAHYLAALSARPDFAAAHNNLGIALVRTGRLEEGRAHFRAALRIDPGFTEARDNLERLREAVP